MRYRISPLRLAWESILNLFGAGPRSSRFTPAREVESRMRFAQYLRRVQPEPDPAAARRTSRMLGPGGAVSRGVVRHAAESVNPLPSRRPLFRLFTEPQGIAARRRALARQPASPLRVFLDVLRVR